MYLLAQVVVNANRVTAAQESVGGMGSDKASASGNQDFLTLRQSDFRLPPTFPKNFVQLWMRAASAEMPKEEHLWRLTRSIQMF
jgi:hypothetical protein